MYAIRSYYVKARKAVAAILVEPEGALQVSYDSKTPGGWDKYSVKGRQWGRAHLTFVYDDKTIQTRITSYNVCYTKLLRCQEANGTGYVGAFENGEKILTEEVAKGNIKAQGSYNFV